MITYFNTCTYMTQCSTIILLYSRCACTNLFMHLYCAVQAVQEQVHLSLKRTPPIVNGFVCRSSSFCLHFLTAATQIMFNIDRAHMILDEMIMNGHIVETNKSRILAPIAVLDKSNRQQCQHITILTCMYICVLYNIRREILIMHNRAFLPLRSQKQLLCIGKSKTHSECKIVN